MNSPIIEEVRAAREALAAKFDFDLHRIYADAVERQAAQKPVKTPAKAKKNAGGKPQAMRASS